MADEGWATITYIGDIPKLRLVKNGFDEIRKLKLPRWQRWIDKHPKSTSAAIAIVVSIVGSVVVGFLNRAIWPPH